MRQSPEAQIIFVLLRTEPLGVFLSDLLTNLCHFKKAGKPAQDASVKQKSLALINRIVTVITPRLFY